jgi:hypothetical protein
MSHIFKSRAIAFLQVAVALFLEIGILYRDFWDIFLNRQHMKKLLALILFTFSLTHFLASRSGIPSLASLCVKTIADHIEKKLPKQRKLLAKAIDDKLCERYGESYRKINKWAAMPLLKEACNISYENSLFHITPVSLHFKATNQYLVEKFLNGVIKSEAEYTLIVLNSSVISACADDLIVGFCSDSSWRENVEQSGADPLLIRFLNKRRNYYQEKQRNNDMWCP